MNNYPKMLRRWFLCIAFATIAITTYLMSSHSNERIKYDSERFWLGIINIHYTPKTALIIDGARFENVRGKAPYYLATSDGRRLVFVTVVPAESNTIHVYDMETKKDTAIPASHATFGEWIGVKASNMKDEIISSDDNELVVASTVNGKKEILHLDLLQAIVNETE